MPGPFMPCDDLMGWWTLRCGVWVVFLLALLGNGVVLLVSAVAHSKLDVPRFLICSLACADFSMGLYLGFLAVVDASTLGEFKKHAIKWQTSPGCLVAGFLGVFSSALSVYTLTVITVDRFYAITHAMDVNKRLSFRRASYIMACGWFLSICLASLPLFGISDYRKFAVCLPFETGDVISQSYVCFIMFVNSIAFILIVVCYVKMYCSVRRSLAWNSNDSRIAKRMALLVFTDFICWAPICFFSLTAAFGFHLISLDGAKILTIFLLPLNSCANPFLYALFTQQFKKDVTGICRRLRESRIRAAAVVQSRQSFNRGSSRRASAAIFNSFFQGAGVNGSASRDRQRHLSGTSGGGMSARSNSSSIRARYGNLFGRMWRLLDLKERNGPPAVPEGEGLELEEPNGEFEAEATIPVKRRNEFQSAYQTNRTSREERIEDDGKELEDDLTEEKVAKQRNVLEKSRSHKTKTNVSLSSQNKFSSFKHKSSPLNVGSIPTEERTFAGDSCAPLISKRSPHNRYCFQPICRPQLNNSFRSNSNVPRLSPSKTSSEGCSSDNRKISSLDNYCQRRQNRFSLKGSLSNNELEEHPTKSGVAECGLNVLRTGDNRDQSSLKYDNNLYVDSRKGMASAECNSFPTPL